MSGFFSPQLHALKPYAAGEQPAVDGWTKLNTNECPFAPSARVMDALRGVTGERLRLYPDPDARSLRSAIARQQGLQPEQVFVGNGSDEVLALAFWAFFRQDQALLMPDVTYAFYATYCTLHGIKRRSIALEADWSVDVERYRGDCGGVVLANPNAPTGRCLPLADIRRLLEIQRDRVVLIDEAYVDFGAESASPLLAEFENLLIVQTFSKSRGLAGLRVGFALGSAPLIDALHRVKNSFNAYPLGHLALAGATAAMEDVDALARVRGAVIAQRAWLTGELRGLGFDVVPSSANFVFARHPDHSGDALNRRLRDHRVLVRHFAEPRIADHLRITIGTAAQVRRLVDVLAEVLRA